MFSPLLTMLFAVLYRNTEIDCILTLAITFGTISYYFIIRLFIGFVIDRLLNNQVDYRARWFQVDVAERKLYEKLKVKKKMGTYAPDCFDRKIHSWDEIAQATCQAELVHAVIMVLSFVPVFASIPFGELRVFILTSVLAACYDAMFVVMQRYNRSRIVKLIETLGNLSKKVVHIDNHS